jgi:hypothetical protein
MKAGTIPTICLWLSVFGCVRFAAAQGCDMGTNYSTYSSAWNDENNIYTSVLLDGSGSCNPLPGCPCDTTVHTPSLYNRLGSTGGWEQGPSGCPSCYLSYQNNKSVSTAPNVGFTWEKSGQVICSVAGLIYSMAFQPNSLSLRVSYWGPPVTRSGNTCYWGSLACTAGTTATCTTGYGIIFVPNCPDYIKATWLVYDGTNCVPPAFVTTATGPGPCS